MPAVCLPRSSVSGDARPRFLDLCDLSIEKLALVFPKCRSKRKYGCVGFDYQTIVEEVDDEEDEDDDEMNLKTAQGHAILSQQDKTALDKLNQAQVTPHLDMLIPFIVSSLMYRKMQTVRRRMIQLRLPKTNSWMKKRMNWKNGIDMKRNTTM